MDYCDSMSRLPLSQQVSGESYNKQVFVVAATAWSQACSKWLSLHWLAACSVYSLAIIVWQCIMTTSAGSANINDLSH